MVSTIPSAGVTTVDTSFTTPAPLATYSIRQPAYKHPQFSCQEAPPTYYHDTAAAYITPPTVQVYTYDIHYIDLGGHQGTGIVENVTES